MTGNSPGIIKSWVLAARPKTLWAAFAPVAIGSALAHGDGGFHFPSACIALLGAMLLQIGTNFCNDYADFVKGADTEKRVGPARAVASGWITPVQMRNATIFVFVLAAASCTYLVVRGGWPFIVLGIVSILAGVLYTAGPYPLAYLGLGDLFVLVFFGPVAVVGTYYIQTLSFSNIPVVAGIGPGLLSVAILVANNLRDIENDRIAGKKTLAVRFGVLFSRIQYTACLVGAALVPLVLVSVTGSHRKYALAASLILFIGLPVIRFMFTRSGRDLNPGLGMTALLLLIYSLALSIGWLLPGS